MITYQFHDEIFVIKKLILFKKTTRIIVGKFDKKIIYTEKHFENIFVFKKIV